jgi:hypothetical protein
MSPNARPPILVSGMVAGDPHQGGASLAVLQYVLGLQRLGHEVYLIEPQNTASLRPAGSSLESSENAAYFLGVMRSFELEGRASLILEGSDQTVGLPIEELRTISKKAAAILNISGMLQREDLIGEIPIRVYLDLDPAFNQLWNVTQGIDMRLAAHNRFVTVGLELGQPGCAVPNCGVEWITTLQPCVLEYCKPRGPIRYPGLTTVANWRGYGSIHHNGVRYGQKVHSLRALMDLPTRTAEQFILALSIHPDEVRDFTALQDNRWRLLDPRCVAATPRQYLDFIAGSKAEFGIAKNGYVTSRCGWFSDRSACYLAFGRPVIAQETGFSRHLPCGAGLFNFSTADDVLAAIEEINRDYDRHSKAASAIAQEYFESGRVLSALMSAVGVPS